MVRNGITCFMEPGTILATDAVAAAAQAVGVRASLCDPFLWDYPEGLAMADRGRARAGDDRARLDTLGGELRRNADPDALVRGHVGLYGMGTVTDELAVAAKRCADENGVVLTLHQNFDPPTTSSTTTSGSARTASSHLASSGCSGRTRRSRI